MHQLDLFGILQVWGNTASGFNLLGRLDATPSMVIIVLAGIGILAETSGYLRRNARQMSVTMSGLLLLAWVAYTFGQDLLLLAAAFVLSAAACAVISLVQADRGSIRNNGTLAKPIWLAYLTVVLSSSLATGMGWIEVALNDGHPKLAPGLLGLVEMFMIAARQTLWITASAAIMATVVFYTLQLIRRRAGGNGPQRLSEAG